MRKLHIPAKRKLVAEFEKRICPCCSKPLEEFDDVYCFLCSTGIC